MQYKFTQRYILSNYFVSVQGRYFVIVTTIEILNHQLILMELVILQIINDMISEWNASYSCENNVTLHSGREEDGFYCLYLLSKHFIVVFFCSVGPIKDYKSTKVASGSKIPPLWAFLPASEFVKQSEYGDTLVDIWTFKETVGKDPLCVSSSNQIPHFTAHWCLF